MEHINLIKKNIYQKYSVFISFITQISSKLEELHATEQISLLKQRNIEDFFLLHDPK